MKLLNVKQTAKLLGVSESTILRMVQQRAIPFVALRSGRRKGLYRFREELLERWVAAHTVEPRGRKANSATPPSPVGDESTEKF